MNATVKKCMDTIDATIAARNLLLHPFYQSWMRGELSLTALRDYATQYYHHVVAFPTYLSALHSQIDDVATRRQILTNLMDEEAGNPNHPELWLRFAESLGLRHEEVEQAERWQETNNLIGTFRCLCGQSGSAQGLAALYAYESQIPDIAATKMKGLKEFYGVDNARGLSYFVVHRETDREHAAVERDLLQLYIQEENQSAVLEAVHKALDALWELLYGVCRRHEVCPKAAGMS